MFSRRTSIGIRLISRSLSTRRIVTLKYEDLINPDIDLGSEIKEAYSQSGLGVLTVSGVPGYPEKRKRLLPLAQLVANLPEHEKEKLVHEASTYSFGWSHGKESFDGKPDLMKGSYYANPQYDRPTEDQELITNFPEYCHPNIWPDDKVLKELAPAFKDLGSLMVDVGTLVAGECDKYVLSVNPGYTPGKIQGTIKSSLACKARLLHYFPPAEISAEDGTDTWCGWHNDHGSLTGLTCAMFTDEKLQEQASPDPDAGLYIRDRAGVETRVQIPKDHIAFQIGETSQVHSGGELMATPHFVRGPKPSLARGVARNTLAVFMQPNWSAPLDAPKGVPADKVAVKQWREGQDFIAFTKAVMSQLY